MSVSDMAYDMHTEERCKCKSISQIKKEMESDRITWEHDCFLNMRATPKPSWI